METKIENVVAFVTGGASGIGESVAKLLILNGGKVVIADINDAGRNVAEELGEKAIFIHTDVTSERSVAEALKLTKEKFGKLNVLVNCAGIPGGENISDFAKDQPNWIDDWKKYFEVNAFGTFNVMKLAISLMKANEPDEDKQRGVIINLGSIAGHGLTDGSLAYGASKAAIIAMTTPIAKTLAPLGIRVVSVSPAFCDTPMVTSGVPDERQNFYIRETMTPQRFGRPEEIAHLIKCVIENHFINAQDIRIDAGFRPCNKRCNLSVN